MHRLIEKKSLLVRFRGDDGKDTPKLDNAVVRFLNRLVLAFLVGLCICGASSAQDYDFKIKEFSPWPGYAMNIGNFLAGDFNGDGKKDLVHLVTNNDYANVWTSTGDGTFDVKSFSPWPGYNMGNGYFLAADINGDGKTDLVHVVTNTDYVNVWISKGDGTFDVKSFSPWPGYAMDHGYFLAADINGDGKTDLIHVVTNTDYVNVWISKGDGTFDVKSFSPWSGYAMGNGYFLVGNFTGGKKADLVHIVTNTDYANVWTSKGDGTFDVKSFSPWPGYAMGNGYFLVGDVTGDKKADLVHIVTNTDYANVWTSKGDGTFDVKGFSPWPGYAMDHGTFLMGDLNHDGRKDLIHFVAGTDYANVWLSKGDGTFNVTPFTPWPGYSMSDPTFLLADVNGDEKTDVVHAVSGTDYANIWISQLAGPGEFAVAGIEVTQSIQDIANSVPLFDEKPAEVRVYLESQPPLRSSKVSGSATISGSSHNSDNTLDVGSASGFSLSNARNTLGNSLNFTLDSPSGSSLKFKLDSIKASPGGEELKCSNCDAATVDVPLASSLPLLLDVLGLTYKQGATTFAPALTDYQHLNSWLGRAYPVAPSKINIHRRVVASSNAFPFTCSQSNPQISAIRNLDVSNGTDPRTHYLALVADGGTGGAVGPNFVRGCAASVPASPDPSVVATAPTGPGNWGWDFDGSYGDWYGGHELAHTFGRLHPGYCNGNSHDDSNFPYPNGQIADNDDDFVGFDFGVTTPYTFARAAMPGTKWFDIMSYCTNLWVSAYAYEGIYSRLSAEQGFAPSGGASGGQSSHGALPGPPARPAPALQAAPTVTRGAQQKTAVTYASDKSVAPIRALSAVPVPVHGADSKPSPVVAFSKAPSRVSGQTTAHPGQEQPIHIETQQGQFLNVVALLNITKRTGHIEYANALTKVVVEAEPKNANVVVRFVSSSGATIAQRQVTEQINTDIPPNEDQMAIADAVLPVSEGTARIELVYFGKVVDTLNVPARAPSFHTFQAKLAVATAPESGIELQWQATHPDGAPMTYAVQVSEDNGQSWKTVALRLKEPAYTLRLEKAMSPRNILVRVVVNDGYHSITSSPQTVAIPAGS